MWNHNQEEIFKEVCKLIVEHYGVEDERVTREMSMTGDLGADSLDIVELIMELEDYFELKIPDYKVEKIDTLQDIVACIYDSQPKEEVSNNEEGS